MTNIFNNLKAPKNEVEAQDGTTNWLTEDDIKDIESIGEAKPETNCTMIDVYQAMKAVEENGTVYLDNVDLKALAITEHQFAGFCSALTRAGLYTSADQFFGYIK